jgi:hypothetical protein
LTWKFVDARTLTLPFVPYWSQFSRYAVQSAAVPLCQAGEENEKLALPVGEVNTAFHPSRTRLPLWKHFRWTNGRVTAVVPSKRATLDPETLVVAAPPVELRLIQDDEDGLPPPPAAIATEAVTRSKTATIDPWRAMLRSI